MSRSPESALQAKVVAVLRDELGIDVSADQEAIQPIGRGYNNNLFVVGVAGRVNPAFQSPKAHPGTVPIPRDAKRLVVRLLKTELGALLERVENEVAALALVREPLRALVRVPEVYAWGTGVGSSEVGPFIVMEYLDGVPLDTVWLDMDLQARVPLLKQIGGILKTLHALPIPVPYTPELKVFGGLTFVGENIGTTIHPDGMGGPFVSADAQWLSMLELRLKDADANPIIKGWKDGELRTRIDAFVQNENGFRTILSGAAREPCFVHGDFKCQNMLYDPQTRRVTGLLDFEFSRIGTFPEELMDGLNDFRTHTCVEPAPGGTKLHLLECRGWPCQAPDYAERRSVGCETANAWREAYSLPAPVSGYEWTARTYAFLDKICPWYFCQDPWTASHDVVSELEKVEGILSGMLESWGF